MTLHKKPHIENKREAATRKLALRLEALKAQGLDDRTIQKDTAVRQIKAAIRQARHQLDRIAEIETLDREKAEARDQKRSAPKEVRPKAKKGVQGESHRKVKREKKQAMQGKEDSEE
jgi:hypothetical protein